MKVVFVADLHGGAFHAGEILRIFEEIEADSLWLLGDILYCGGWSQPNGYNRNETARLLNERAARIVAVRGNCDSDADVNILHFPAVAEYAYVLQGKRRFFLTHGHLLNAVNFPYLQKGDVFMCGHSHEPRAENVDGVFVVNPGSIALPRSGYPGSYGVLCDDRVTIHSLDGAVLKELALA